MHQFRQSHFIDLGKYCNKFAPLLFTNKVLAVLLDFVSLQYFFQFEGGLHPTSLVVYATYTFSEYSGKAPAITEV